LRVVFHLELVACEIVLETVGAVEQLEERIIGRGICECSACWEGVIWSWCIKPGVILCFGDRVRNSFGTGRTADKAKSTFRWLQEAAARALWCISVSVAVDF